MPSEADPIFLIIVHSMMENIDMPQVIAIANCREAIRKYFVDCLASSTTKVSLHAEASELLRATLDLVFLHHADISEVEEALEAAGVETESTPGSVAAMTCLHRFSGLDLNE